MIVGIDLGTTTSEIAVLKDGKPVLIREIAGSSYGFLPSVVALGVDGKLQVGAGATAVLAVRPGDSVAEVKRLMGSEKYITLGGESYSPQEISAVILRHLKEQAETALGESLSEAVISVPAYFTAVQRRATHDAAELAGFSVRRLVNEPTAAALAYGAERPNVEEKIVVYDLGGGTLDVTVLELSEGVLDVIASTGNPVLGGKDFDERLMTLLANKCVEATGIDPRKSLKPNARLRAAARRAKEELSSSTRAVVVLDNLAVQSDGAIVDWEYVLTREEFEEQVKDLVECTTVQLDEALAQRKLGPAEIDIVLMVGGSSRVPFVRACVSKYFGGRVLRTDVNPDEAVALGAAILAGIEDNKIDSAKIVITDVSPWTLGVSMMENRDGQAIAGVFSPLIQKQTTIPRTATKHYSTIHDWQDSIRVEVYQGDAPMCAQNIKVGEFQLAQLERAPAGADVEISFTYNLNGELEVVARALGRERRVVLQPSANHLTDVEKRSARDRIDRRWATRADDDRQQAPASANPNTEERARRAPLYTTVAELLTKAENQRPKLSGAPRTRLDVMLIEMRAALIANDPQAVSTVEQALTNLLFELL